MAAPQQTTELPSEAPAASSYPPPQPPVAQPQPAAAEYTSEPKVEASQPQPQYAAPSTATQQPRRGLLGGLDLIIVGVAGVLFVFNFIVLVLAAIRVSAANDGYDYLYYTLSETKYLLAMSVIDIFAIAYLAIYGSGFTSVTNMVVDKQSIAPTVLASIMALLFLIGGAIEARFASYDYFCNYYIDYCVRFTTGGHGQFAAAAAFAFFVFLLWTFVAVWCGLRTRKAPVAAASTV